VPKSLAELQSSPDVGLPEKRVTVCVSAKLVEELSAVDEELFDLVRQIDKLRAQAAARREGDAAPPTRLGESTLATLEAQAEEKAGQADAIRERIQENNVEILLRAKPRGEWRQWASRNPARSEEESPKAAERDKQWAAGRCNIDAVENDLRLWVVSYNGEESTDAWADFLEKNGAPAHLTLAASTVVGLHEQTVNVGKVRSTWLADRRSATSSD
jgi:hypothetical protein